MTNDEVAARDRVAAKLKTVREALLKIQGDASYALDKRGAIAAGRRLERIHIAASAALTVCDAE